MFPVLFHAGSLTVHTYGVMLMLAFLAALGRAYAVAKRRNDPALPPDSILDVGIWMILVGTLGARLLFVVVGWRDYAHAPDFPANIFKVWEGGLSFHGGLFAGIAALIGYCLIKRLSILRVADLFAPSVMLAYVIGRLGCFFNGCCYGAPTAMPWGIRFHDDGIVTPPSHPTQLYASALSLVFFAGLVWLERRQTYRGQIICWYMLGASVERFLMEIWRAGTTSTVVALGLTDVQWLCLVMAGVALTGMAFFRRRFPVPPAALPPASRPPLEAALR